MAGSSGVKWAGYVPLVQDIPQTSIFSYLIRDPIRYRMRGMTDAAWYFAERGGPTTDQKGLFWTNYGYKAIVVNDYDLLVQLLVGQVDLRENPNFDEASAVQEGTDSSAFNFTYRVLEREAAFGACPFNFGFFQTSRAPLNCLNLQEHDQLKKEFFTNASLFANFKADTILTTKTTANAPRRFQSHLAILHTDYLVNPFVESQITLFLNDLTRELFPKYVDLGLIEQLVNRIERSSTVCPGVSRTAAAVLADRDALNQLKTNIAAYFRTELTAVTLDSELSADKQLEELVMQMAYILCHHHVKPLTSILTNVVARLQLDPTLKKQIGQEVIAAVNLMDPDTEDFWKTLADSAYDDQYSLRVSFANEVLRVHPPQELVYMRATKMFNLRTSAGFYRVKEGDRLIGNIRAAQRDNRVFGVPSSLHASHAPRCDEFDITRFTNTSAGGYKLANAMLYRGGLTNTADSNQTHICPAERFTIAMVILYTSLISLCDFTLKERPYWSGLRAFGLPDIPPEFATFKYNAIEDLITKPKVADEPLVEADPREL